MNAIERTISEEALIEIFSEKHPYWKERLQFLSAHFGSKAVLASSRRSRTIPVGRAE